MLARPRRTGTPWLAFIALVVSVAAAPAPTGNPMSKVFFAEVRGDNVFVQKGDRSQPVSVRETYNASGLGVETQADGTATMVLSNGVAVQLQANTRVDIKRFVQEPFRPDRSDVAQEPSISDVVLDVAYGTIVISTSTLAPGSRLIIETPRARLNVLDGTMVVVADSQTTDVSVVSGKCTVYGRMDSTIFRSVGDGDFATVRPPATAASVPAVVIEVTRLTDPQRATLADQVSETLRLKRTVYFEQKNVAGTFASSTPLDGADGSTDGGREHPELNPIPVIPTKLPVQFTISPASLLPSNR